MERRKFVRLNVELEVEYRILESLKDFKITQTEDVSEGGIRIMLPEKIEPRTHLEIAIKIPNESKPVFAIGRVVWTKSDVFGGVHMTGIQLVHIKQKDRERLYKYAVL